jgi:integrase
LRPRCVPKLQRAENRVPRLMRKLLTDAFCKAMPAPPSGRAEIADLRCAGLAFRITANGTRSWAFRFRDPKTGNSTRATIGTYPDIGLGDARARADKLRETVAGGANPVELKRRQRSAAKERSFAAVAERFMVEHSRRHKRSSAGDDLNLNLHILPRWKGRQIEDITRADVIAVSEELVRAGTPVAANRVQALVSSIFSFALDSQIIAANPCSRLKKRGEEGVGTRVLSDDEIRLFWVRSVLSPVTRPVGLSLRLCLLTGARSSEAAQPTITEFVDLQNPAQAAWLIPGERTKNKLPHWIPLSEMALATVKSAIEMIDKDAVFLFPSRIDPTVPIEGHALGVAMRRMGESDKLIGSGAKSWKSDPPTPHDLRRTFSTMLSALGVPKEDRDACMNHVATDVGSKHYTIYDRRPEKRAAVDLFSRSIAAVLEGKPKA